MTRDPKARRFALSYDGGYISSTLGLIEHVWGSDWEKKAGEGKTKTITRKEYTRQRVIGGAATRVGQSSFSITRHPRRINGGAAGGQPIKIVLDGKAWGARMGGSVQSFKKFLNGAGHPNVAFTFITELGGEYTSGAEIK